VTKRQTYYYDAWISGEVPADSREEAQKAIEDLRALHGDGAGDWIKIDRVHVSWNDIQPVGGVEVER